MGGTMQPSGLNSASFHLHKMQAFKARSGELFILVSPPDNWYTMYPMHWVHKLRASFPVTYCLKENFPNRFSIYEGHYGVMVKTLSCEVELNQFTSVSIVISLPAWLRLHCFLSLFPAHGENSLAIHFSAPDFLCGEILSPNLYKLVEKLAPYAFLPLEECKERFSQEKRQVFGLSYIHSDTLSKTNFFNLGSNSPFFPETIIPTYVTLTSHIRGHLPGGNILCVITGWKETFFLLNFQRHCHFFLKVWRHQNVAELR